MRDVAALAGVSLKTVSRVVNEEAGVSPDVRERVGAAVRRLDYRPNLAASNLRRTGARTGLIGALVQDLSNSFSAGVLRSLEDIARAHRTAVLAASLDEGVDREQAMVHDLVTRRVDGLVLMPASQRQDYLVAELRTGTPAVFVDRPPRGVDADSVVVDNLLGARLATEHLLDHGHRRIAALFHLPQIPTAHERIAGFTSAHTDRGVRPDDRLVVEGITSTDEATEVVHRLLDLDDPPTAIFAGRNILASGAVRALAERGLRRSVALVSFDDFPMADLLDPGLTVVRQDVSRIGRTVAQMLFERIGGESSPPRHVVIEPTLVVRGSGEIPPPA
ncbi:LacI family DNA-binding transcriptional regulator [Phycicoccus sonneratiae]|uniref:LacI family DNA-binding transcriptional regulator n=1 Tax=Phycicoccus sonneratiae TaxID=2807628 RepID=A0ABS2CP36_9MICO|nr:LacI family DNA-binding transcriptional regulator [Phycicoccus sonneraticus]MBM6401595.1 LacI family DNA-binding transcriptional regulator [Phycicoccus sonneraticus]